MMSQTKSTNEERAGKKWSPENVRLLIDLWGENIEYLRGVGKNSQTFRRIAGTMVKRGINVSGLDVKNKIDTLKRKYRQELEKVGPSGGVSSDFALYTRVHTIMSGYKNETVSVDNIDLGLKRKKIEEKDKDKNVQPPQKQKILSPTDELLLLATENLKKKDNSSCQMLGDVWVQQLNEMTHQQRLISQKLINDVIFNGMMGLLNMNTDIGNLTSTCEPTARSPTPFSGSNYSISSRDSTNDRVQYILPSTPSPSDTTSVKAIKEEFTIHFARDH